MKKIKFVLVFLALTAMLLPTTAATRDKQHYIGAWGGVGYSGLPTNSFLDNKFVGSAGGMLGAGYEFHYKKFMLNVGPEFRLISSRTNINDQTVHYNLNYNLGGSAVTQTKHYTLSDYRDKQLVGQLMVPVLFGGNFNRYFFLAGAKVGMSLFDSYKQKATLTTTLTDPWAMDDWQDMPVHGLETQPFSTKGNNDFGLDLTASAEFGIYLDEWIGKQYKTLNNKKKTPVSYRASIFCDYGVYNMGVGTQDPLLTANANTVDAISVCKSSLASSRLNSLLVGAKFAVLFQVGAPKPKAPQRAVSPLLYVKAQNTKTDKPVPGVKVMIVNATTKRTVANKLTDTKLGRVAQRLSFGNYVLKASKAGYLPNTMDVAHQTDSNVFVIKMRPEPVFSCVVRDANTQQPVYASVEIVDAATNAVVYKTTLDSLKNIGSTKLKLDKQYTVNVTANGYMNYTGTVDDIDAQMTIAMNPVVKGTKVVLNNLFFATNETRILPASEESLNDLYTFLNENSDVRIKIVGHTDNVGTDAYNLRLSQGRAQSVKDNIVKRGIDASRIECEGRGNKEPIATNETEEGRATNRRVEFIIL